MTKDMFKIKPKKKRKNQKESEAFKMFKETNYWKKSMIEIKKKFPDSLYPKKPELLNFYEMPEIDITDIGSIRSAY
jgi:hypothetical protein